MGVEPRAVGCLRDPNVGEAEGGGLTDRVVRGRLMETVSQCFEKSDRTIRAQRRQCNTREQCHRGQLRCRSTETKNRPLTGEGLPTVGGCLSEPGEEGVKADSTNP